MCIIIIIVVVVIVAAVVSRLAILHRVSKKN